MHWSHLKVLRTSRQCTFHWQGCMQNMQTISPQRHNSSGTLIWPGFIKTLSLHVFHRGLAVFSPGFKSPLLKCLRIFCHVETFSVSHYSFIAHLSGAPCNSPQSSQITKPDKKHFVSSSPNLCLLAPEHCVRTRSGWHAVIHADAGTFYSHLQYVNQYMHVYILLLGIIRH